MRVCTVCKSPKPLEAFPFRNKKEGIRKEQCKECVSVKYKDYRKRNYDKIRAREREYNRQHKEERKEFLKKWKADDPEKWKAASNRYSWNSYTKRNFGISIDEYREAVALFFDKQKGRCAICDCLFLDNKKNPSLDHCHQTGRLRGLLCHKCNSAIGMLRDDPRLVAAALNYLQSPEQVC